MISTWKLIGAIWITGMLGVVAMTTIMLPTLLKKTPPRRPSKMPGWAISVVASIQGGIFLAIFVWVGAVLAWTVGLRALFFEALVGGGSPGEALLPQLLPGLAGGLVAAVVPWYFVSQGLIFEIHSPRSLLAAVLYGGITEEIFARWGLMTFLVWLGCRFSQNPQLMPSSAVVWSAIVVSAVLFGAGHLPSTRLMRGRLTASAVISVIGGGTFFGVIAGYLYFRYGLESAMICHATSHVVAYVVYRVRGR